MAQDDTEIICLWAEAFQKIIDDCLQEKVQVSAVVQLLQQAGASYDEASDYLKQFAECTAARSRGNGEENDGAAPERGDFHESTPEGLVPEEADKFRQCQDALKEQHHIQEEDHRKQAADDAAWALLRTKASMLQSLLPGSESIDPAQQLVSLLGLNTPISASSLPPSVLMAAPHLAKLSSLGADTHLDSTWKLRVKLIPVTRLSMQLLTLCSISSLIILRLVIGNDWLATLIGFWMCFPGEDQH